MEQSLIGSVPYFAVGDIVTITGVTSTPAVNGTWRVTDSNAALPVQGQPDDRQQREDAASDTGMNSHARPRP